MQVEKIKKGDEVNFIRPMTNIKTYGTVIDITKDGKYLNIRNSIGDLDFIETSKVKLGGKPYKGFALGGRIANKKFNWVGNTFTVKKLEKGKVYTTSGRIFNLDALEKAGVKFEKDPNYKPIIRPLYGEAKELAKDRYYDMLQELKDLKAERKQLFMDMEYEAGLYDIEWTDDDANRYGGEFNRLDDAINSLENKTKQLHDRIYNYEDGGELIDDNEKKPTNWAATNSKLLINHDKLTPVIYRKLMSNARNGILKQMAEPDDKVHFWNPSTKEYVAKITTYKGEEKYYYSNSMDENGNLTMANGGDLETFSDNQRMIMNQNVEVEHHHEELEDILQEKTPVPAWVVAKMETATQNLSDITHYLDGQKELMEDKFEEEQENDNNDDNYDDYENEEEIEVVEPIIVNEGTKTEISKNFIDDAWDNFRGFLKGMEGVDLRDDYTFDYKGEQFEIEPIINSDEKGVSNAIFSIFDGDGEEIGEVAYSREGGKQKFTANSEFFGWNNTKFEDGGYFDGTIPKVSSYMSNYGEGGKTEDGVDLFEDYENIPPKLQEVLDKHQEAFENGEYRDLEKALKEVNSIGYTFEYYLDGQAYDLRKIGEKGKSETEEYATGGGVENQKGYIVFMPIENGKVDIEDPLFDFYEINEYNSLQPYNKVNDYTISYQFDSIDLAKKYIKLVKDANGDMKSPKWINVKIFDKELQVDNYNDGGSLPFMTDPNFGNFQNTSMFNDGGKLPKVGDEVSGRWNDSMKWTLGTFKGETKNGFEVYNFTIEEPDHIEYYAQITQNPNQDNTKIFYSNNFKDRNYKNYNFKRENGGFMNDVYAYGGHLEAHGLKLGDKIIKTIGNYQKVQNKEGNIVYVDLATGYRNTKEPTPFNNGGKVEKTSSEPRIMIMNKYIDKFGTHYGVNLYLLNVKINNSNEEQVQKYIDEGLSPFDIYEKLKNNK